MQRKAILFAISAALTLSTAAGALAQGFAIDWWTVDSGGAAFTTGGDFELSGTIGQPDAGEVLTGGDFELIGGFWQVPYFALGDMNCDGWVNNGDIDAFVFAMSYPEDYPEAYPHCDIMLGDVNGDGWVNNGDIDVFIDLINR